MHKKLFEKMLRIRSLWKFYGEDSVLKDISYDFSEGLIYIIAGENGAGKTSLLSVLAGTGSYQEGKIEYIINNEADIDLKLLEFNSLKNAEISSAFPLGGCYDYLSVFENIELATPLCPKHRRNLVIYEILDFFKLAPYSSKKYHELSKGYQQRTSLAVAFVNRPRWVILDEPTVYLDQDGLSQLVKVLQIYKEFGTSFIISSHDKDFVNSFPHVTLNLTKGELKQ